MARYKDVFKIGKRIEIVRDGAKETEYFPSQILDIIDDEIFIISGPIHRNNIVLLHRGENIEIAYLAKNRGMYIFTGLILERDYDPIYKVRIRKTSEVKRYQKREYYRFETSIPVIKSLVIEGPEGQKLVKEKCRTRNISGGGLNLLSNYEHQVGDQVFCNFDIREEGLELKAEIVRINKVDAFDYDYTLGLAFSEISERDRDIIIKFIFEEERIMREKGLI